MVEEGDDEEEAELTLGREEDEAFREMGVKEESAKTKTKSKPTKQSTQ